MLSPGAHALSDGDNQRGRNQMAMIRAILDKASSPPSSPGLSEGADAVSTSLITSLTYEGHQQSGENAAVGQRPLEHHQLLRHRLGRHGAVLFRRRSRLWVSGPTPHSETAKGLIQQVLNGETPTLPQDSGLSCIKKCPAMPGILARKPKEDKRGEKNHEKKNPGAYLCPVHHPGLGQLLC